MVKSTYQILKEIRDLIRAVILMLLAIMIFLILGCTKPPDTPVDCDCGHIIRNYNDGELWTVVIQNDCDKSLDSTVWHFNMDDFRVGDVVCRLHEVEFDSCKI